MESILESLKKAIINYQTDSVMDLTRKALEEGVSAEKIIFAAGTPALDIVGKEYENGNIYLPEMLMAGETLGLVMDVLRPILSESGSTGKGKVVMGTVEGDIHSIGLGLVCMLLEGNGYDVINLGVDVPAQKFVDAVKEHEPKIVGMSALLTTTAPRFADVIKALLEAKLRDRVKVMIGGVSASQQLADHIGADGYGDNAYAAVKLSDKLAEQLQKKAR